jgi:hypothetical protein
LAFEQGLEYLEASLLLALLLASLYGREDFLQAVRSIERAAPPRRPARRLLALPVFTAVLAKTAWRATLALVITLHLQASAGRAFGEERLCGDPANSTLAS